MESKKVTLDEWLTFMSVTLAASVYAAAWTLPNAVLPQMQGDLSVSLDQVSWVVTASVVAGAVGIPLTPWLRQRLGARLLMLLSLGAFSISSIMVATVSTIEEVVLWRIISALAGSPLIALSQAVTMDTFPRSRHPTVFAIWSVFMASGWVFAPTVGAWLADLVSWRLTFLSVAPFGFVAFMCCAMFMRAPGTRQKVHFDWMGFLTLAVALTMAQIVANQGQRLDWFDSRAIIVLTGIGCIAFYLYIVHTLHCSSPFLNWAIFKDRNLVCGVLVTSIYAYIGLVPMVLIPGMMEEIRGLEVFTTGLVILPRGMANLVSMIIAGVLVTRVDPRILLASGLAAFALSSWQMAQFNTDIGTADVAWPTIIQGAAMGFIWVPAMALMYATIESELRTSAATMISLTYSLSSSFGIALSVTVLTRSAQINNQELAAFIEPANKMIHNSGILESFNESESLASIAGEVAIQSATLGYTNVFWMIALSALVIIPLTFLQRRPR